MMEILSIIYDEPLSISEIYRRLHERGVRINRQILTGYLKALEECRYVELVKTKNSKNSKKYVYKRAPKLYSTIRNIIASMTADEEKQGELCLYTLYRLHSRPVLESEIKMCSIKIPKSARKVMYNSVEEAYIPSVEYKDECIKILSMILEKNFKEEF